MAALAPLDDLRDARPRPARRHRRATGPYPATGRADPLDLQRNPAPAHRPRHRTSTPHRLPRHVVNLEAATPTPSQNQPLPAPTSMTITIYGWSTRSRQ